MIPFIDLATQHVLIRKQLDRAIDRVRTHGRYIMGPEVTELEDKLAAYTGARYCISCGNGTDALQIALMALGVGPGDEVITPAFTYAATAEAVKLLGANPVYADIDLNTFCVNTKTLDGVVSNRTKAIIPVSLFGHCADMDAVNQIAEYRGVSVIEDAAQSFGATYRDKKSCNLSRLATTSFFPAKPLGCYGDGGAIFTSDDELADKCRMIARHGQSSLYCHEVVGVNSRLDTLQAAILLEKLKIFEDELSARNQIARRYTMRIDEVIQTHGFEVELPNPVEGVSSAWAQYTMLVPKRDVLREMLAEKGIPTSVYYPKPLNQQPAYTDQQAKVPVSEFAASNVLSLPMHPYLTESDQQFIIDGLESVLHRL